MASEKGSGLDGSEDVRQAMGEQEQVPYPDAGSHDPEQDEFLHAHQFASNHSTFFCLLELLNYTPSSLRTCRTLNRSRCAPA
jgi:hypothetical protein